MNAITQDWSVDIEKSALLCGKTPDFFDDVKAHLHKKMRDYDREYGPYMIAHMERTASEARRFLIEIGIDTNTANIIADAFSLHDSGKILQDIKLWAITKEKPVRTPEDKAERPKHGVLGVAVLNTAIMEMGIKPGSEESNFITLIGQLMVLHHERLDGSGPQGIHTLDRVLRALTIIDQIDGKAKAKELTHSFDDMSGKHETEFDQAMVAQYRGSCEKAGTIIGASASPVTRQDLQY